MRRLVADGNTVVIIEHKLSLIAQADWVIDMGPEDGADGGEVLFSGVPADLLSCAQSKTAAYLAAAERGTNNKNMVKYGSTPNGD